MGMSRRTTRGRRAAIAAAACAVVLSALTGCGQAAGSGGDADVTGTWTSEADGVTSSLEFADDGSVTGSDGCNTFSGDVEVDGDTVTFGPLMSTLKGCPGMDTWLSGVDSAVVDGDTMTVMGSDGEEIGTLERS